MKLCFSLILFISLQCFSATQLIVVGDTGQDNEGQKIVADV